MPTSNRVNSSPKHKTGSGIARNSSNGTLSITKAWTTIQKVNYKKTESTAQQDSKEIRAFTALKLQKISETVIIEKSMSMNSGSYRLL